MTVEGFDGRLDKYLSEALSKTRSFVQKIIEEGNVWVNQSQVLKPAYKVKSGDIIKVVIPEPKQLSLVAQDIDIEVVYEDEHLAV